MSGTLTMQHLQRILDRENKGLLESGLGFTALDVVDDLVREVIEARKAKPMASSVRALKRQVLATSNANEIAQAQAYLFDAASECHVSCEAEDPCLVCEKVLFALDHLREAFEDVVRLGARVPAEAQPFVAGARERLEVLRG